MEEGHSLDHGHKTDIISGKPIDEEASHKKEEELVRLQERQAKHKAILKDLRSSQGQLAIEKIHEELDKRVQELIEQDPVAKTLMGVLQRFGAEIVATRQIRKRVESLQRLIDRS